MAEFGVGFKLNADVTAFSRGMREAGESAKGLKRTLGDTFGENSLLSKFSIAGFTTLFVGGMLKAADAAQDMRDKALAMGKAVDDGVASAARFGDAIDKIKEWFGEATISGLSFFTRAGEGFGMLWNKYVRGIQDGGIALSKAVAESGKAAEEQERKLAEARKQYGPEALAKAEKELADARRKTYMEASTNEEKYNTLMAERFALAQRIDEMADGTVAKAQAQKKFEELTVEINKARLGIIEDENKNREEIAKLADEYANTIIEEGDAIEANNQALRHQADLTAQTAENTRLAAEQQERNAAAILKSVSAMAPVRTGAQFNDASDETLRGIISRNRAEAARQRNDITKMTPFGNLGSMEAARLETEAQNAQSVIDARNKLRRDVGMGGVEYARSRYGGDPLMFDSMIQRWVSDTRTTLEIAREQTQVLKDLDTRLAKMGFNK